VLVTFPLTSLCVIPAFRDLFGYQLHRRLDDSCDCSLCWISWSDCLNLLLINLLKCNSCNSNIVFAMMRGERRLFFCLLLGLFAISFSLGQSCTGTSCDDCVASSSAAHNLECGFCYDTVGSSSFCANGTSYGPSGASCSCLFFPRPKLSPKVLVLNISSWNHYSKWSDLVFRCVCR